jgi:lysophospholipase L1-like esterase
VPRLHEQGCLISALALFAVVLAALALVWIQAAHTPKGRPAYVALGSSYAAGAGLGPLQKGSPLLCARSVDGYPQQLARMRRLSIVDMSCGGAVTPHLLHGGQFFQGPQIRVITPDTRLVTITVGGNDINYVGDLSLLAARHDGSLFGWLARTFWRGPKPASTRGYAKVQGDLVATVRAIQSRAPKTVIVIASYPTVLPPSGTCPRIGLTVAEAELMREVERRLAAATAAAAAETGAVLVDMNALGAEHNACAAAAWINGWKDVHGAMFHPTALGARATAEAISRALDRPGA